MPSGGGGEALVSKEQNFPTGLVTKFLITFLWENAGKELYLGMPGIWAWHSEEPDGPQRWLEVSSLTTNLLRPAFDNQDMQEHQMMGFNAFMPQHHGNNVASQ